MATVELLIEIPPSGKYEEINFGNTNELTWVLFTDENLNEYIGKFNRDVWGGCKVEILKNGLAIILSGGLINLFDINNRKLLYLYNESGFVDFIIDKENELIIMHDYLSLSVFDFSLSLIHETKRVSLDGFEFEKIENGILLGKYNSMTEHWGNFKYDILLNNFICDWKFPEIWR